MRNVRIIQMGCYNRDGHNVRAMNDVLLDNCLRKFLIYNQEY